MSQSKIRNLAMRVRLYRDWWKVVVPYNRIYSRRPQHFVTLRTGERLQIRDVFSSDLSIITEVFGHDVYHLRRLHLPQDPVVFDIGAHIGAFSVAIHSRFCGAQITAFEPHPGNFEFLKQNAPFATCIQAAVTSKIGSAHLESENRAPSAYALGGSGMEVATVSLRPYLENESQVDILKIDVEGAEKEIIESLPPELLAKVGHIVMEVHRPADLAWFVNKFKKEADFEIEVEGDILFAKRKTVPLASNNT